MESKQNTGVNSISDRLQSMQNLLMKCKIDFLNDKEECKRLRDISAKMELELKEARELEKSHRYHLQTSREMIANLQETVSQLVNLKRDVKKLKDDIVSKDITITSMEKDRDNKTQKHNNEIMEIRNAHERHILELIAINDKKLQQIQYDSDTQIAQFSCVIEELRGKLKDMEAEHRDKMSIVVLEYEEKIQRSAAEVAQLQEQLARQTVRTDVNIDAYRRKLEDLEEKLKQSQFKEYLAQSSYPSNSQYENRVERPYSVNRDYSGPVDFTPVPESPKLQSPMPTYSNKNKTPTLQVMYCDSKAPGPRNEKKGHFNITKKRKLYSEKDFLNQ